MSRKLFSSVFICKLRLFGLSGVHIKEMALIFCPTFNFIREIFVISIYPCPLQVPLFMCECLYSSATSSFRSTSEVGGWKALCIFKLFLLNFGRFYSWQGFFCGFSILFFCPPPLCIPHFVLPFKFFQLSRGFSEWLQQLCISDIPSCFPAANVQLHLLCCS